MFKLQATAIVKILGSSSAAKIEAVQTQLCAAYDVGRADKAREVCDVLNLSQKERSE